MGGNFAILGNHDVGTYDPYFTEADKNNNVLIMNNLIKASGYQVLNDEFKIVNIGKAKSSSYWGCYRGEGIRIWFMAIWIKPYPD